MTLEGLYKIIENRKEKKPKGSYVASLINEGKDKIIQKVGEESTEVIIAAKNQSRQRVISEVSDLLFHVLVLLSCLQIELSDIYKELDKRKR